VNTSLTFSTLGKDLPGIINTGVQKNLISRTASLPTLSQVVTLILLYNFFTTLPEVA
jgi:hypothetical protein